jgi:hypothetical protein
MFQNQKPHKFIKESLLTLEQKLVKLPLMSMANGERIFKPRQKLDGDTVTNF